jgi:2-polyprenyl-3-methyl-5-hydroxy-6-metoxy-1,4-benzoquinol methylase
MKISTEHPPANIDELFLEEYSAEAAIRKYTKETAGEGISYLLENDYGKVYLDALENSIPRSALKDGVRLIEFGCGGGMNLVHLVSTMERKGIPLQCAYGTDFSEKLIEAANQEAKTYLSPKQNEKIQFCMARNENLADDLAKGIGAPKSDLIGSFHLILGVNTFRYCQRLKADVECARAIFDLLTEGGICIMIDMNKGFPLFRSRFRDRLTKDEEAYYLPSLEEYARPFATVGFELLRKENFCWIPHSAGPWLTRFLKALTPALNSMVPNRAMRSLVISRKPGRRLP